MSQSKVNIPMGGAIQFEAEATIFRQEDEATRMFLVQSGHVRLRRRVFREEIVIETLGPGSLIGEVAIAAGARYTCTATAVEPVIAMPIRRDELDGLISSSPELAVRLARKLSARVAHSHFRLGVFALREFTGRVMLQLRAEAVRADVIGTAAFIPIPFDLPEVLGAERGNTDDVLRELSDAALVDLDGAGRFRIADIAAFDRRLAYAELKDRFGA
jgi:CRP-like cAMP-binding protein